MSVNIGINIQRSPNRINQQLREAGALGKYPKLLLDFKDEYYLTNGGSKTLENAINHVRNGNATMTDGYGGELVVNGDFLSNIDDWSVSNGTASWVGGQLLLNETGSDGVTARAYQAITTVVGTTYWVTARVGDVSTGTGIVAASNSTSIGGKPQQNSSGNETVSFAFVAEATTTYIVLAVSGTTARTVYFDNVSVKEMPVLKWAPHNLFTESENLADADWIKTESTVTQVSTTLPDGTTGTASRIQDSGKGNVIQQLSTSAGQKYTIAIWAKRNGATDQTFRLFGDSGGSFFSSDFTATEDWQLFEYQGTVATGGTGNFGVSDDSSSGTYDILVWGAHLYRSDLGGMVDNPDQPASRASYVPTTSSAKYLSRVGHHVYNGSAWTNEGLLAESEARTNLVPHSNLDGSFSGNRTTITANEAVSPDGTESAAEVVETTDAGTHYASIGLTVTASTDYTLSAYVKQGSGSRSVVLRTNFEGSDDYIIFDFSSESITETGSATSNATSQDVGNGWYRIAFTYTQSSDTGSGYIVGLSNSATPSSSLPSYTGDGSSSIYVYGAQFEQASTPSSLIPTSGSSVTRAAESFTIPSANLPWPEPNYIGDEEVTNGGFDTDSDWTKGTGWTISGGIASSDGTQTASSNLFQVPPITLGKLYAVTYTLSNVTTSGIRVYVGSSANGGFKSANGTYTDFVLAAGANAGVYIQATSSFVGSVDNISVREIDPLSVSIAMDGRVTYADEDSFSEITVWGDDSSGTDGIQHYLDTRSTETGQIVFRQEANNVVDDVATSGTLYSAGILVPFNISARHGSTFVNGCADGVSLTANTTPTALPDLSAEDLDFAHDYMGTVGTFRVWDRDITDDGLVEATNPSLEPSLSLTFEGTGTNSFTVSDWSE